MNRKPATSPESALASEVFDQLCAAGTLKAILGHHRHLCEILKLKPTNYPQFYPKLRSKLGSWKAQALWNKFDKRASHKCYNRGKACHQNKVLIIGAGPCGLRAAIEAQLLGARVVVVEKRDRITRNNVLHLWPFVIQDLRGLGAKKFFGKFCAGAIDHISIRQLQCILLKVALILGVEIHEGVGFEELIPPPTNQESEKTGWRARVSPPDHPVSQFEFDVLIGADGKRNTLEGFKRKEFRGKLAIAITANFINRRTEAEARVQEISGVAFIFNQKFFKDLYSDTGIDLENIVYYKDDTHYFVMTAKKHSLIDKGVIVHDYADTARLLDPANVDKEALLRYAKEAADFSTNYMLPNLDFAVNHYGQPDVAMFDFTSMYAAENASRIVERHGHKLLQMLVGDSLLEPFWPTGSGCARGFLSSLDACWVIKNWSVNGALSPLEVVAERESIYRLLGQTTPENLQRDLTCYTLDPHSRYPNLNTRCVLPLQVRNLFETDDPTSMELALAPTTAQEVPKKRRRRDSQVHPDTLLQWLKRQVCLHQDLHVDNMTYSFRNGTVLCAIISRYRPDLLDFATLKLDDPVFNNQRAFDILEELGIAPVMNGREMWETETPDRLTMLSYLSQVYDTFRGEIPHIKHPRLTADLEEAEPQGPRTFRAPRKRHSGTPRAAASVTTTSRAELPSKKTRKRRSGVDKLSFGGEERQKRLEEIEENRMERQLRRRYMREMQTEQFKKSLAMVACSTWRPEDDDNDNEGFIDYSLHVYRQTAPEFQDRVKELEMKLLYPDREARLRAELRNKRPEEPDEDFSGRIKDFEEKLMKGSVQTQKKPRDLLRAIGKIEKSDWNVKEIEKKIEENKFGRGVTNERPEKVPKWSRQQFDDKFQAMEKKLINKGLDQETASRYAEVDLTLKRLEQKLKDGSTLETGQRGSNKVSAMAEQFAVKTDDVPQLVKSSSKGTLVLPAQGASEKCHFCDKRVYLMERVSAEGKFFHRSCFKCEYCATSLRVGNYMFDREGKYGNRFFCNQHFGMPGTMKQRMTKSQERNSKILQSKAAKLKTPDKPTASGSAAGSGRASLTNKHLHTPPTEDALDRGATPERIEFENLAEMELEEPPSEMDEDEWTDRNFGASCAEGSSDDLLDGTDSEEEDEEEDGLEADAVMDADHTRQVAELWTRRHSSHSRGDMNGQDSCEADDSEELDDVSEDEDSDTATEGEEDLRALELRKQEVRLQPQRHRQDTDTGSDTEVASDDRTSSDESSEEEQNSATEISTDSEFEHDGTTPTRHEIPDILITDHNVRRKPEEPRRVQVRSGNIAKTSRQEDRGVKLQFSPLVDTRPTDVLAKNTLNSRPMPFVNPRRGDYLLSKTQSTEGIATKMSLELRKKYLLGTTGSSNAISKSGSATALDPRIKTFGSKITECQKLLNPGSEISPTMQAFLNTKPVPPTSPTINTPPLNLPPSSMIFRKQKELPQPEKDYIHVCGKPSSLEDERNKLNVLNENVREKSAESRKQEDIENKNTRSEENKENEELKDVSECRPRSPVHETSILVPQIPWQKEKQLSDSLSETESESETSTSEDEQKVDTQPPPPRLEIRNSKGELMDEDNFEMDSLQVFEENEGHSPMSMTKQIELARAKISELKNSIAQGDSELKNSIGDGDCEVKNSIGEGESELKKSISQGNCELRKSMGEGGSEVKKSFNERGSVSDVVGYVEEAPGPVSLERDLLRANSMSLSFSKETKSSEGSTKVSNPSSPLSADESCHTFAALTETELSDWARDGDIGVSEGLDDIEDQINKQDGNKKQKRVKPKKPKTLDLPTGQGFAHICGKNKMLASTENLDFMDTDVSEMESVSATNDVLLENRGYFRFVNEEDMSTPIVENGREPTTKQGSSSSSSSQAASSSSSSNSAEPKPVVLKEDPTTTEESTTSEQTTIKNSPLCNKNFDINDESFYSPLIDMSPIRPQPTLVPEKEGKEYEDYVQRLQGRISPFHNVRDSIDYRRAKQKGGDVMSESPIKEEEDSGSVRDPTTRKLQEISRERTLQKDLVHEMVLKKMLAGKKSPGERKVKRVSRSGTTTACDTPPVNETYHTPMTSIKSVGLPDTPMTNPDAFPIVTKGGFDFKTPVAPPRDKRVVERPRPDSSVEREKIREDARARARLKSDEELGLSPEDHIRSLRSKADEILKTPVTISPNTGNKSNLRSMPPKSFSDNLIETPKTFDSRVKYMGSERLLSKSSSTSKVFDKLRGIERTGLGTKSIQKSTSDLVASCVDKSSSSGPSTSTSSTAKQDKDKKRSRDRERRRSIIQAVSDFFHKKSPSSPPPPKSPTSPSSPSKPDKLSTKFKLNANSKGKKDGTDVDGAGSVAPPPVPPPPLSYKLQLETEESCSELDEGLSAMSTPTHGSTASVDGASRRSRMTKRMARQAQLKRLRMAQEIQRRLEEVEEKQKELEVRGVALEKALRGEDTADEAPEEAELLRNWFELVRERNELRRYEKELLVRAQEMELEDRHARLQQDLRDRLAKDDASKSQEEVVEEGEILREMLDTVEKRDALTALLEQERQRYQDEDKDLEAQVLSKGLRLTPIRKYEYQSAV